MKVVLGQRLPSQEGRYACPLKWAPANQIEGAEYCFDGWYDLPTFRDLVAGVGCRWPSERGGEFDVPLETLFVISPAGEYVEDIQVATEGYLVEYDRAVEKLGRLHDLVLELPSPNRENCNGGTVVDLGSLNRKLDELIAWMCNPQAD